MTLPEQPPKLRAAVFVDGNNLYHSLKRAAVGDLGRLNFEKLSRKLILDREWICTRYYVGQVKNTGDGRLYNEQRKFLSALESTNPLIKVVLGRIEVQSANNETARRLKRYLADLTTPIDPKVFQDLMKLASETAVALTYHEKAVDVGLAVDVVAMAARNEYDVAFIVSADGDFTPAVSFAQSVGKRVFAASPGRGAQLAAAVDKFIPLKPDWFLDCFDP